MSALHFVAAALLIVAAWFSFWQYHARKLQTSGHTAPDTSAFAKLFYLGACKLVGFLTIGPIKVVGKENSPKKGRVLIVANHQIPADFAMVRAGAGRHYRALGDAAQFTGLFGVFAAWVGIVSVTFKTKAERAAGQLASVKVLAAKRAGLRLCTHAAVLLAIALGVSTVALIFAGSMIFAFVTFLAACGMLSLPGGDVALVIAPQGALMPDNELKKEEFRAGAIRVARDAAVATGEPVHIVPMAILYKRDPKEADWSQRFFNKTRSLFLSLRNPRHWDPLFKLNLEELSSAVRAEVEAKRAAALKAYKTSQFTIYGGVVVVGEPIEQSTLPADAMEAIEVVRLKIAELLEKAKKH